MKTIYKVKIQFTSANDGHHYKKGKELTAYEYWSLPANERDFVEEIKEPLNFDK
jgi:hypothetical protein